MKKVRLRAVPSPAIPERAAHMRVLKELCRAKVSEIIQAVLIAEVDEFLGRIVGVRGKSAAGYRDGYQEQRTITYGSTPVAIRRPRVRESEVPFASEILPPYKRRFPELDKTMHELWLQGLSTRDFEPSLRALLGETTPLSPSTISRSNKQFLDDYRAWSCRPIVDEHVYLRADGIYLDAGAGDERRDHERRQPVTGGTLVRETGSGAFPAVSQGSGMLARRRRSHDRVLRLSQVALEASANDQHRRVQLRPCPLSDQRLQTDANC